MSAASRDIFVVYGDSQNLRFLTDFLLADDVESEEQLVNLSGVWGNTWIIKVETATLEARSGIKCKVHDEDNFG